MSTPTTGAPASAQSVSGAPASASDAAKTPGQVAVPAPGSEERAFWLEAAVQHGFEETSGDELIPAYDPPAYFATEGEVLALMAAARQQGRNEAAALASPPPAVVPESVRRLSEAATRGPFSVSGVRRRYNEGSCVIVDAPGCPAISALATADGEMALQSLADAKFFVAAANHIRDLCAARGHAAGSTRNDQACVQAIATALQAAHIGMGSPWHWTEKQARELALASLAPQADLALEIDHLEHSLDVAVQERNAASDLAERLRQSMHSAIIQARGALHLATMASEDGKPNGTTTAALRALEEAETLLATPSGRADTPPAGGGAVADALAEFQRRNGYHKPEIEELLTEFGDLLLTKVAAAPEPAAGGGREIDEDDREIDRILAMSGDELRAELVADGHDPDTLARQIKHGLDGTLRLAADRQRWREEAASWRRVAERLEEEKRATLKVERARIAKIIDGDAFRAGDPKYYGPDLNRAAFSARQRVALYKADAILSAPTEAGGAGGDGPCTHPHTEAHLDYVKCTSCGMIRTGSAGWTIAKRQWFRTPYEAHFYEKYGRLPEPADAGAEGGQA